MRASNLPDLLARLDACVTYFIRDFIPLVTTLTDHPANIADPQTERLFTSRFKADTLQIKAWIECVPDISSHVRSRFAIERREVKELNRSITADRAKLETAQHTLNTYQQALRRREERLAADERNLTEERTELEPRKLEKATKENQAEFRKLLDQWGQNAMKNLKAPCQRLQARKVNQEDIQKLLGKWEQKAIESFEAPCQRLQEEMLRQEQVHQATTAGQAKDLAERCGDIQNHLNQQKHVQQEIASKYERLITAAAQRSSNNKALRNTTTDVVEETRQALSQDMDCSRELMQHVLEKTIEDTVDQRSQGAGADHEKQSKEHSAYDQRAKARQASLLSPHWYINPILLQASGQQTSSPVIARQNSQTTPTSSKGRIRYTK
ncbi:MAG: hypothetical protein Q9177_003444 [Variospora cf. flavescens]